MLILPERIRKRQDPFISPVPGKYGPCALCGHYSKLTEDHVPPESVGNDHFVVGHSYMTSARGMRDRVAGTTFPKGVCFRTLCQECNNGLGHREDKALKRFYEEVQRLVTSQLALPDWVNLTIRPTLVVRAVLAHLVAANDKGYPSRFDDLCRDVYFGKKTVRESRLRIYYWHFAGDNIFLMRDAFAADFGSNRPINLIHMHILKAKPIGFAVTRENAFPRLPNLAAFCGHRDDEEREIPFSVWLCDPWGTWPAIPVGSRVILGSEWSYGLVARRP